MRRSLPWCATVVVAALLVLGCGGSGDEPEGAAVTSGGLTEKQIEKLPWPKQAAYIADFEARQDLASTEYPSAEAREWLKGDRNGCSETAKENAQELVDAFYDAGSPKVWMTLIDHLTPQDFGVEPADEEQAEGVYLSDSIIVEIGEDPETRKAVIALAVKYFDEWWGDEFPAEDYGLEYIEFTFY